jgi:hypothetical protein
MNKLEELGFKRLDDMNITWETYLAKFINKHDEINYQLIISRHRTHSEYELYLNHSNPDIEIVLYKSPDLDKVCIKAKKFLALNKKIR